MFDAWLVVYFRLSLQRIRNNMWMNPLFRHSTALSAALDRLDRPEHSLLLDLKIVLVQDLH